VSFSPAAERLRRRLLSPLVYRAFLWARLPLGAFAGMRVVSLDETQCTVRLPGGWRTRNPFGSTYFAAQAMAAELSTGAPALVLTSSTTPSVAMLVVELRAVYERRIVGCSRYVFSDVAAMREAIARALAQPEPVRFVARTRALGPDGETATEFEVTWSFKRRSS
jgi:hypothetical protein